MTFKSSPQFCFFANPYTKYPNAIDKSHSEVIERLKMLKELCDDKVLTDEEFNEIKKNLIEKIKEK